MILPLADTHVHIWDFAQAQYKWLEGDTSILNKTYSLDELEPERKLAGVTHGVLVQAANNFADTDWMLKNAEMHDWIAGVVGWLPLTDPAATARALEHYSQNPYFKGVRHLIHNEANDAWLLQPTVIESLRIVAQHGLSYDVVGINCAHIETAIRLAEQVPQLRMVFDHLNQPPIAAKEYFGRWGEFMIEAARHPNFLQKVSGLGTASGNFSNWTAYDIQPYIEFVLQHFGTDRCFCGGDWPVSLLAGSYSHTWAAYEDILQQLLNDQQQHQVFFENASSFYRL